MSDRLQYHIPASYLLLMKDNMILLQKRVNTGYQDGKYIPIAGHVEQGESFTQCVIREAREEAGIILKEKDCKVVHILHRDSGEPDLNERIDVFFIANKWQGIPKICEPYKCSELAWFEIEDLPEELTPYVKDVLVEIKGGTFYSEAGWS